MNQQDVEAVSQKAKNKRGCFSEDLLMSGLPGEGVALRVCHPTSKLRKPFQVCPEACVSVNSSVNSLTYPDTQALAGLLVTLMAADRCANQHGNI